MVDSQGPQNHLYVLFILGHDASSSLAIICSFRSAYGVEYTGDLVSTLQCFIHVANYLYSAKIK